MANYATLIAAIQDVIKTNGNNEITGSILQQALISIINSLGAGYQFVGIANESTNPGTPDQNVFYIAGAGTYPNFNSAVVPDGHLGALKYNGSWTLQTVLVGKNYDYLVGAIYGYEQETATPQELQANKYFNTTTSVIPIIANLATLDGTYCCRILVSPGEKYRIYGKGNSGAIQLYALGDSNRNVIYTPGVAMNTRTNGFDLTIPDGAAVLAVNLYEYNAATDKVEKITTQHVPGLEERVTALENGGQTGVIDRLDSTSTTDALSANQGRVLNEEINGVTTETQTDMPLNANKYFNTANARIPSEENLATLNGTYCCYLRVEPGEKYRIYGKGNSGNIQLYAMADADRYVVQNGTPGVAMNTRANGFDLTIPNGVYRVVVNLYQYDATTDKVQKIGSTTSECIKTRLNALEANDVILAQKAQRLFGKKIMFFGDSITEFTYNQKGVVSYFAEESGALCYKAAIGGTRLSQRSTPVASPTTTQQAYAALDICNMVKAWAENNYTLQDAATSYLGEYSARVQALKDNPISAIDIVVIGGGTNDISGGVPIGQNSDTSLTTINGAINQIVSMLLTANPALKIYFWSPIVGYYDNNRTPEYFTDNYVYGQGKTRPEIVDLMADMVKLLHIPYFNLYWNLGWNQLNFAQYFVDTDGTHPYKGFDVIARRLYGQILSLME